MINEFNAQSLLLLRDLYISHSKRSFKKNASKRILPQVDNKNKQLKYTQDITSPNVYDLTLTDRTTLLGFFTASSSFFVSFCLSNHLSVDRFVSARNKHNSSVVFVSCVTVAETTHRVILSAIVFIRERLPVCFTSKHQKLEHVALHSIGVTVHNSCHNKLLPKTRLTSEQVSVQHQKVYA